MPVLRLPFEHLSQGRWQHFANWVRSLHIVPINAVFFGIMFLNEQVLAFVNDVNEDRDENDDMVLIRCYDLLRAVVTFHIGLGSHLEVSYISRRLPYPETVPFLDLSRAARTLNRAALDYSRRTSYEMPLNVPSAVTDAMHVVLEWIQCRAKKTLAELADECVKGYFPDQYAENVQRGTDMASIRVLYH
jgi:hypothetical protein